MKRKIELRNNVCSVCKKPVPDTLLVGRAVPPSGNHSKCSGAVAEVLDVESKKQQKTKASAAGAKARKKRCQRRPPREWHPAGGNRCKKIDPPGISRSLKNDVRKLNSPLMIITALVPAHGFVGGQSGNRNQE